MKPFIPVLVTPECMLFGKQWRPRWNDAICSISSGPTLFANTKTIFRERNTQFYLAIITCDTSVYYNGPSQVYCIKPERWINYYIKCLIHVVFFFYQQEELSETLSKLVHDLDTKEAQILFLQTFFVTEAREWNSIDIWRIDKFMMVRFCYYSPALLDLGCPSFCPSVLTNGALLGTLNFQNFSQNEVNSVKIYWDLLGTYAFWLLFLTL